MSAVKEAGVAKASSPGRQVGQVLLWALRQPRTEGMPVIAPTTAGLLVERAAQHGVAGLLHQALQERGALGALGGLGPSFLDGLTRLRVSAAARHLLASADTRTLAGVLEPAAIPWVVMKGPVLAALGYGDASLRWSCDIDVLVEPREFSRAIDLLVSAGATLLDLNWELQLALWRSEATLRLPLGTTLDLHWHPVNDARARAGTRLETEALLSRRRMVSSLDGALLPALDPVDNLITVALHASLSGGHRLVWAKDLERLCLRDEPDWDEVARRALAGKVGPPVGVMLQRAQRLLGASVPSRLLGRLVGESPLAQLFRLGERLASPSTLGEGSHTGKAFMCSLRGTPAASAAALARTWGLQAVASAERAQKRCSEQGLPVNPLRQPAADSRSRGAYLEAVGDHRNEALRRRLLRRLGR
jgi:hypothetical protein